MSMRSFCRIFLSIILLIEGLTDNSIGDTLALIFYQANAVCFLNKNYFLYFFLIAFIDYFIENRVLIFFMHV